MSRFKDYALWACLPVFNTLNQVAMKMTAGVVVHNSFGLEWFLDMLRAPYIWMSFGCEIINFVVWLAILKRHDLSHAFPLTAVSYATLMLTSWLAFHEPMTLQQLAGVTIIMIGIAVMGFKKQEA